jgi:DeoR/GlpR family transcriptional regulator of sugar metabolism
MSTGKTKYLGLHRWEPNDNFLRTEFNENSDKLDSELEQFHAEMADEFSAVRTEMQEGLSDHHHDAGDITGGTLRDRIMVGDQTMRYLLNTSADKTFLGCEAVYEDGEFSYNIPTEIGINEVMVACTRKELFFLADHTKIRRRSDGTNRYGSCTYEKPWTLITDEKANPDVVERLRSSGMKVIQVEADMKM